MIDGLVAKHPHFVYLVSYCLNVFRHLSKRWRFPKAAPLVVLRRERDSLYEKSEWERVILLFTRQESFVGAFLLPQRKLRIKAHSKIDLRKNIKNALEWLTAKFKGIFSYRKLFLCIIWYRNFI